MRKVLFLTVIFVFGVHFMLWAAFASIDKVKIRIEDPTGSTASGIITLENKEDKPIEVKIYPMEWRYVSPYDGSKDFMPLGSSCPDIANWFQVYPEYVRLMPGERQSVHYKLNIPDNLKRPCYLVIFFETDLTGSGSVSGKNRVGLQIFTRIGSLLLVEPSDIVVRSADAVSVTMSAADRLTVTLNNKGNAALIGSVSVFVMDRDGNILARTEKKDIYMPPQAKGDVELNIIGSGLGFSSAYTALVTIQPEVGQPISVELPISSD